MVRTLLLISFLSVVPATLSAQLDSAFSWVNPRPVGDDLYDALWLDPETFVAVSSNGFIYRTSDAGVMWDPVHFEMYGTLNSLAAGDGIAVAGGQAGRTHRSTDRGRSWEYRKIPDYPYTVQDIHIFNRDHIIVVGSNLSYSAKIAFTRDGMKTWTIVNPDSSGYVFGGVDFIDDLRGWVCGSPGVLLKTRDGGETWSRDTSSLIPGKALNALAFRNQDTGVVAGDVGRILVTHDGGATWTSHHQSPYVVFREAEWIDDSTVVLVGDRQQFRSTDAGRTWQEMQAASRLEGIGFDEAGREGMAVGVLGAIIHTRDGGANWLSRGRETFGLSIRDLDYYDETRLIAVGSNAGILYSRDSGTTWTPRAINRSGPVGDLLRVAQITPDTVVAMSATGIFYSTDGGENWTRATYPAIGELNDMFILPSGIGYAVGRGTLLRTTNRGVDWKAELLPAPTTLWAVRAVDSQTLYVTADGGRLFFTRNGGLSWTERHTNSAAEFTYIQVDQSGRNITLGWEAGLFVSSGAGILWEERRAPVDVRFDHFSFISPLVGWAVQAGGVMLSTADGGMTWQEHEYGIRQTIMSVVEMVRPGYGFLAGNSEFILRYSAEGTSGVNEDFYPPSTRQGGSPGLSDWGMASFSSALP